MATFNRTNGGIEWARWSWNPVTGCKQGCPYCYARDMGQRFQGGFAPTYHPNRMDAPFNTPPSRDSGPASRNVFVCSMADLFGDWIPSKWIENVLKAVWRAPWWNFIFLTKFPHRMSQFSWPGNAWVGATVDTQARAKPTEDALAGVNAKVKFVSCEPMLEPIHFSRIDTFQWVIIGGRSRSSRAKAFSPPQEWVDDLIRKAHGAGCLVFCKRNLGVNESSRLREIPDLENIRRNSLLEQL